MTEHTGETRPLPAAGWYADPQRAGGMRYWDGTAWGQQYDRSWPVTTRAVRPVGRGFSVLSGAIGVGLVLMLLTLCVQAGLYVWGITMVDEAIAAGDLDRLSTFDDVDRATSIVVLALLVLIGISWMVWQYLLSRSAGPGELERSPAMHAWSWVIPIGAFWLPFQNVRDLWRNFAPDGRASWIRVWWVGWLALNVVTSVTNRSEAHVDSVGSFKTVVSFEASADVAGLVAAVLAVRLLRTLTSAALARSAATAVTREGWPAA